MIPEPGIVVKYSKLPRSQGIVMKMRILSTKLDTESSIGPIFFVNFVHGLIIYIFSGSIQAKSASVVTFWRQGSVEEFCRFIARAIHIDYRLSLLVKDIFLRIGIH